MAKEVGHKPAPPHEDRTGKTIEISKRKIKALFDRYTVPCPHCGKPILSSVFASTAGRRASAMRKTHGAGSGRPKKASPCQICGEMFGVADMRVHARAHRAEANGK